MECDVADDQPGKRRDDQGNQRPTRVPSRHGQADEVVARGQGDRSREGQDARVRGERIGHKQQAELKQEQQRPRPLVPDGDAIQDQAHAVHPQGADRDDRDGARRDKETQVPRWEDGAEVNAGLA